MFASLIGSTIFLASSTVSFLIPTAFASSTSVTPPTIHELVDQISLTHGLPTSTIRNLIDSESDWDQNAEGDNGCSWGLAQINICAHKNVSKEDALDPATSLNWTADRIAEGNGWWWTSGNCYSFVLTKVPNLPRMAQIQPNTTVPHKGFVAIFYLHDKKTGAIEKHIAYVLSATKDKQATIQEANKEPFVIDTRTISPSSAGLVGYFDPSAV